MSIDLSTVSLPFDRWGNAATNKIVGERQTLTSVAWTEYNILIPAYAPFYSESIADNGITHLPTGNRLVRGKDWIEGWYFQSASGEIGLDIHCCIYFYDPAMAGEVEIASYQAMGGEWQINEAKLKEILADLILNPLRYYWEQVAELPEIFNPLDHDQDIQDFTKLGDLLDNLTNIAKAIQSASGDTGGQFTAHLTDFGNPHKTNKAHVGLALVQNYAVATSADVALDTLTPQTYLNPPVAKVLIDLLVKKAMDAHLAIKNPTNLTAADLDAYNKLEVDSFLPLLASGALYDLAAKTVGGMTVEQVIAAAKSDVNAQLQNISNSIRETVEDVIANSSDINATTFDHKTAAEWQDLIGDMIDSGSGSAVGDLKDLIALAGWATVPSIETLINQQIADADKDTQGNPVIPYPLNATAEVTVWFASFKGFDAIPAVPPATGFTFTARQRAASVEYLVADNGTVPINVRCAYDPSFTKGTVTYITQRPTPAAVIEPIVRMDPEDGTMVQFGFKYKGGSMPDVSCQAQAGDDYFVLPEPIVYMTAGGNAPFPVPVTPTYTETVVTMATAKSVSDLAGNVSTVTNNLSSLSSTVSTITGNVSTMAQTLSTTSQGLSTLNQTVSSKNQGYDQHLSSVDQAILNLQQNSSAGPALKQGGIYSLSAGASYTLLFSNIPNKDVLDLDSCRIFTQVFDGRPASAGGTAQKYVNSEAVLTVAQDANGIYLINQTTDTIQIRYHFEFDKK